MAKRRNRRNKGSGKRKNKTVRNSQGRKDAPAPQKESKAASQNAPAGDAPAGSPQLPAEAPVQPPAPPTGGKPGRFTLDRVSIWSLFILTLIVATVGYVLPLVVWIGLILFGKENPQLTIYISNGSAAVGFISVCLGLISLHQSWQSDRKAEETTLLLRDVQGMVTSLKTEIGLTNAMLKGMYTNKATEPPASKAGTSWRQDKAQNVEADKYHLTGRSG